MELKLSEWLDKLDQESDDFGVSANIGHVVYMDRTGGHHREVVVFTVLGEAERVVECADVNDPVTVEFRSFLDKNDRRVFTGNAQQIARLWQLFDDAGMEFYDFPDAETIAAYPEVWHGASFGGVSEDKPIKINSQEVLDALLSHLSDHAHDLEVDRESMEDEYGFDFVGALRQVVKFIKSYPDLIRFIELCISTERMPPEAEYSARQAYRLLVGADTFNDGMIEAYNDRGASGMRAYRRSRSR